MHEATGLMEEKTGDRRTINGEWKWKKFPPHPGLSIQSIIRPVQSQLSDGVLGVMSSISLKLG